MCCDEVVLNMWVLCSGCCVVGGDVEDRTRDSCEGHAEEDPTGNQIQSRTVRRLATFCCWTIICQSSAVIFSPVNHFLTCQSLDFSGLRSVIYNNLSVTWSSVNHLVVSVFPSSGLYLIERASGWKNWRRRMLSWSQPSINWRKKSKQKMNQYNNSLR